MEHESTGVASPTLRDSSAAESVGTADEPAPLSAWTATQAPPRGEVVIGLVGALGTDLRVVERALIDAFMGVGYRTSTVRVSQLITEACEEFGIEVDAAATKLDALMDKGDALRLSLEQGNAAARLAVTAISRGRRESATETQADSGERGDHATVIRQLKHPDEVRLLRSVYGARFVLIGAWSPRDDREKKIDQRLRDSQYGKADGWYADNVKRLLARDEKDASQKFGQKVRETFQEADAYFALLPGKDVLAHARRLIHLLFGAPYETPTWVEQAMYQAAGARLRSADAGRQVGAVVVDEDGEVVVTGVNEVPKAGGGQYWTGDDPDHREFQRGYDENERQKVALITDVLASLQTAGWLSEDRREIDLEQLSREALDGGPLTSSRVGDLLEFGRVAHAEMAAICTAARRGTAIRGLTLVGTTYPCHECARLIIASGLARVIYVDPYPKSQVPVMYQHEISEGPADEGRRVVFEPFQGVAPRLFPRVFAMPARVRDDVTGQFQDWSPGDAVPRLVAEADVLPPIQWMEDEAIRGLMEALQGLSEALPDPDPDPDPDPAPNPA